ncbi:MAG: hypothetical protein EXS39_01450 [Opitutaceae bacterium]|nr:hypothetical protein [Opitutaceae bacterium]
MARAFVIFVTQLLLWLLLAQVNHYLAPLNLYLFAGGLFVTFAALRLPLRPGLAVVLLGGLICDANMPIAPHLSPMAFSLAHTHLLLFGLAFAFIYRLRDRMARDQTPIRVFVALLANLGLFLALSFTRISASPAPAAAWLRLFFDLACSQVALALMAPWFFALQVRALELTRTEPVAID